MSEDNKIKEVAKKIESLSAISSKLADNDVSFYRTVDSAFAEKIDASLLKILELINTLIGSIDETADRIEPGKDALNDGWKSVANVLDGLYEKSDIAYDSMKNGLAKPVATVDGNSGVNTKLRYMEDNTEGAVEDRKSRKRQAKPQLQFRVPVDNSESGPFKPKIKTKPNALEPMTKSLAIIQPADENDPAHYKQPYEYEIDNQEYPESILTKAEPIPSRPWPDKQDAVWVDTVDKLNEMLGELKGCPEIAVDLEHHDYRTYYGIVCLMQISNRDKDWLVDTLALRDDLAPLNEIFTDPKVVKVFHGAFMDIIWLQRDLGLYIVSLFDTYHASKQLGLPKHSLAYLLETYSNFKTNKKYQMADWRIRPLTPSMRLYARADTHFLLNIYDQLRNKLIDKSLLNLVLHESRQVAKRRFEYYGFRPADPSSLVATPISDKIEPWRNIMKQHNISLIKKQLVIDLYNWRDKIARRDDESVRYVMPNQLLVSLVTAAPIDSPGVLASSNYVTDHVRMNSNEIAEIIQTSLRRSENEDLQLLNAAVYDEEPELADEALLTDRNIHSSISKFNTLQRSISNIAQSPSLLKTESSYLPSAMFPTNTSLYVWSINFKDSTQPINYTIQDLNARGQAVYNILNTNVEKTVTAEIPFVAKPVTTEVKKAEQAPKENKNEIIVIRKKVVRDKSKKPKTNTEPTGEVVDYQNAENIFAQTNDRKRNNPGYNTKKRKAFDPYGQDYEEPRAAKKVYNPTRGKNVSYRKKQ